MILAFFWSASIVIAEARQLRSNASALREVLVPPSRAYLNDIEYQRHKGNLIATSTLEHPEILMEGGASITLEDDKKIFDVCEQEHGSTCKRKSCETSEECAAFGQIKRGVRGNVPRISGNSPGSYCAVSEKYEFIFVHVLKNAGSSTKKWLREATKCSEDRHPCAVEMKDCLEAMVAHPKFFRWTWARHPFDRALSIYAMAKHYELSPSVTFKDFWLAGKDRWSMTDLCDDHAKPQSEFMLDKKGCLAVDYVANLDNATAEWPRILDMIGSKGLKNYENKFPFMQPQEGNVFGKAEAAGSGVDNGRELVEQDSKLKRYLLQEFEQDFNLLF